MLILGPGVHPKRNDNLFFHLLNMDEFEKLQLIKCYINNISHLPITHRRFSYLKLFVRLQELCSFCNFYIRMSFEELLYTSYDYVKTCSDN